MIPISQELLPQHFITQFSLVLNHIELFYVVYQLCILLKWIFFVFLRIFFEIILLLQRLSILLRWIFVVVVVGIIFLFWANLQTHAVESNCKVLFLTVLDLNLCFYSIKGSDKVENVLFEREKENIRVQSKFELPRNLKITVNTSYFSIFVTDQLSPNQTVAIRHVGTQIVVHVYNEIVLEGYLEILFEQCM